MSYYPYGQERTSTADGREKFGTYFRDGAGQDYADQRYYNQQGSFWTPDPSLNSNASVLPGNWNKYAYVGGDPINKTDPRGLCSPQDNPPCYSATGTGQMPGNGGGGGGGSPTGDMQIVNGNDGGGGGGDSGPTAPPTNADLLAAAKKRILSDLSKPTCASDFSDTSKAGDKLGRVKFKDLGTLKFTTVDGQVVPAKNTAAEGQANLVTGAINLNTQVNWQDPSQTAALLNGKSYTYNALAAQASYTEAAYDPMGHYRYTEPAAFVDDIWRVTNKLSIDLGLRYEYMMAMYSTVNNLAEFVPSLYNPAQAVTVNSSGNVVGSTGNIYNGLVRVANGINPTYAYLVPNANNSAVLAVPDGAPRGMYPSRGTWSPRVGFAYSLNNKTVIRGGAGFYYDRIQGNPTFYTLNNPPYVGTVEYQNGNLSSITGGAVVNAPWGTIQTIDPNLKIPYSMQFSFGIQRELPYGMMAQAYYVGTLSRHLLDEPDINQPSFAKLASVSSSTNENFIRPYPGYSTIQQFESRATSNYHSLQMMLTRRVRKVFFTATYTFSKNLGDASSDTTNNYDAFNVRAFYGPVTFDVRHVITGTAVLELPQLRSQMKLLREPFGSWQLSATVGIQTGFYYSVTGSSSIVSGRLADYIGGPALLPDPGPNGWFNAKAFAVAPYTRWGTAGPGDIEGPGLQKYNLSISKLFLVNERHNVNLRVRGDFINAFNCVNFQGPSTNISSTAFGTISAAYPSRNIQLGMKLTF